MPQLAAVGPVLLADRSRRRLQGAIWDPAIPSFPLILKDRGYHIGFTHKVWSPGTPADAPYGGQDFAYHAHGERFNQFSQFVSQQKDIEAGKKILYEEVRGNFRDFLNARPAGKPFCYWFGPTNVHRKWVAGSGKALWGLNPDKLKGKLSGCVTDVEVVREDVADYLGQARRWTLPWACFWKSWKRPASWKTR